MSTTITKITPALVHPTRGKNLLFVHLETADGNHGWGECYTQADRDTQVLAHLEQLERYVIGWDARQIKQFTDAAYNDFAARRGAMDYYSAISGLEQAMWDLAGKRAGMPVHDLLGGRCRDRIRVYANGWARNESHEELAKSAQEIVTRGFTAMKFDPVPGPWRSFISRRDEDETVRRVATVREAVGPDIEILVEMHRRLAPMHAIRIGKALEEYRPFWFEEPILAENIPALSEVQREVPIPVVTGEELYTKFEFREVLERHAADILNPDVCNVGGILELKEIAAMAEPYFVAIAPHNYNSTTVGLAATLQASATMPNFLITEYFVNLEEFGKQIAVEPFEVIDGHIEIPVTPGIGIDLNMDALKQFPYQQFPRRNIASIEET